MPQFNVLSIPSLLSTTAVVKNAGDAALNRVEWFGSLVSSSRPTASSSTSSAADEAVDSKIDGTGGTVYNKLASTIDADGNKGRQVWAALANLEKDSK